MARFFEGDDGNINCGENREGRATRLSRCPRWVGDVRGSSLSLLGGCAFRCDKREMLVANAIIQKKSKVSTFAPNAINAKARRPHAPQRGTASSLLFLAKLCGRGPPSVLNSAS